MPTQIQCTSCQSALNVPESLAGKPVKCPRCGAIFTAPASPSSGYAAAPPPAPRPTLPAAPGYAPLEDLASGPMYGGARPEALPGTGRAVAAMIMLGISALQALIGVGVGLVAYNFFAGLARTGAAIDEESSVLLLHGCVALIRVPILIGTAVAFCMWMYRAHDNLKLLEVSSLRYSPGWAAGAFFVPFLNLIRPYQIAQEIYKASDPETPGASAYGWSRRPGSAVIGVWWTCWIIMNILGQISFRVALNAKGAGDLQTGVLFEIISDVVEIAAAGLAMLMIKQIQDRQLSKYESLLQGSSGARY